MNRAAAILMLVLSAATAHGQSTYVDLMQTFEKFDHRLPSSDNFEACLSAVEKELQDAGLETHRQTYNTLVPRTKVCRLIVDGREISPVWPLGPNGIAVTTTGPEPVTGPLLYLGQARLAEMNGKPVRGSIAIVELGSANMDLVFAQGARAVVFIGNEKASQWEASRHFTDLPLSVPRLYVPRAVAEEQGLLTTASSPRQASVETVVVWEDAGAVNLWTRIPGQEGLQFDQGEEEAIILAADLATSGVVPDYNPQMRAAANAALLAHVSVQLASTQPKRSIFMVFFGSRYSAQDGARHFYYAVNKAKPGGHNTDPLDMREGFYRDELRQIESQIELLNKPDFLSLKQHPQHGDVAWKLRQRLDAWVNNLNFELRTNRLAQDKQAGNEALLQQGEDLNAEKKTWNDLRRQLFQRQIEDQGRQPFAYLVKEVTDDLEVRRQQTDVMLQNNLSFQALANQFKKRTVVGHFGFDFSSSRRPWLFQALGDISWAVWFADQVTVGGYAKSLSALGEVYQAVERPEWPATLHAPSLSADYRPGAICFDRERSIPSIAAISLGLVGYQLVTAGDSLDDDEMPRRSDWDLADLGGQMAVYFGALADAPKISLKTTFKREVFMKELTYTRAGGQNDGRRVVKYAKGSAEIEGPAAGAILAAGSWGSPAQLPIAGCTRINMARVNGDGFVFIPNAVQKAHIARSQKVIAFDFDEYGQLNRFESTADTYKGQTRLFYGYGGGFFTPYAPLTFQVLKPPAVLGARTNATPKYQYLRYTPSLVAFYNGKADAFKYLGNGLSLLSDGAESDGEHGLATDRMAMINMDVVGQSAHDYAVLNAKRLGVLRSKNIVNDSVEILQAEAEAHLGQAAQAREQGLIDKAAAHEVFSLSLGYRAYEPLRAVSNDMVRAVVILLVLSIPFAFALERLLFGFPSVYKQLVSFAAIFVGTFGVLYVVHPAFSLASAPIVIFLAFMILLMSTVVIYIVMGRFRQEVKRMQGMASSVHGAEQDSSTALAAVLLGISAMRNRPLKTALIATTIILLTFTILVFASFSSRTGVVETYMGKGHGPDRIELHSIILRRISPGMVDAIQTMYPKRWHVFTRGAVLASPTAPVAIYNPLNGKTMKLDALLGLDPDEAKHNEDIAKLIEPAATEQNGTPIRLSELVADELELKPGQNVIVQGRQFTFIETIDKAVFQGMVNLDYTKVVPPDFAATVKEFELSLDNIDTSDYEWCMAELTAVTDVRALDTQGAAEINYITLYPKADADVARTGSELASVFEGPVYAKGADGTKRYFFTQALEGSNVSEVLVPLLLGGLIIFSSLLGSIVDREREIFTYSALGLAPPDVATLFFAESGVYAVLGGLGGYLFSQIVAKLLGVAAAYGWLRAPEMNFSSLSATYTILIVMGTVILSTIYPAVKAGKSANPGVARKWRMPEPEGNRLKFVFPFTVSASDMAGILSFIREHFDNHNDASLGNFAARSVELFRSDHEGDEHALGIRAEVSLAPFDLGVYQRFAISSQDSDIEGIQEVVVELERLSGSPAVWVRGNRKFIAELRNQFLLWRSLPIETVESYRRQTDQALDQAPEAT